MKMKIVDHEAATAVIVVLHKFTERNQRDVYCLLWKNEHHFLFNYIKYETY